MAPPTSSSESPSTWRVHPVVERLGAYSWRLLAIGIVAWIVLRLIVDLQVVFFPLAVATMLTVVLSAPAQWLRERGARPLVAAWVVFLGFIGTIVLVGFLVVPAVADEFDDLGPTVEDAYDDVQDWIVEDSPFDVDRRRLEELKDQAGDAISEAARGSSAVVVRSALLLVEVVTGLILALVLTFFFVKDGERFQQWALSRVPEERHDVTRRMASRAWSTLGGYIRGSAILGVLEGIIIGTTIWLTGSALAVPVGIVTFAAAFIPFVGAVVAGILAVAVTLATAGPSQALVVAGVALVVQQLDNDFLAPFIFGKALELHPVVILLAIASGGTLAGLAGAFLAVPITAIIINVLAELRADDGGLLPEPEPDG
jgi:predicted PurR-regulated permease PerM